MEFEIHCPSCQKEYLVYHPFTGAILPCQSCGTNIVLAIPKELEKEGDLKQFRYTIKRGRKREKPHTPHLVSPEKQLLLREEALFALSRWLDLDKSTLEEALDLLKEGKGYNEFSISKGPGRGYRKISAPSPVLKKVQRQILDRLLYRIPVSNACHGFMPRRSIVTNAKFHLPTAKVVYNVDLKDAFPSVSSLRVKHLLVRYIKIPLKHLGEQIEHETLDEIIHLLVQFLTYQNSLPQGSPASGYLLNIACIKLDKYLYKLLREEGLAKEIRYTRYADDLTFSSQDSIPETLRRKIISTIRDCGFQANTSKTKYLDRGKNQVLEITGLILEKGAIRIPRDTLERYRATIHRAYLTDTSELTEEMKVEVQSIVAFVKMVYPLLPYRISKPYKMFIQKHNINPIGSSSQFPLSHYPKG